MPTGTIFKATSESGRASIYKLVQILKNGNHLLLNQATELLETVSLDWFLDKQIEILEGVND